MGKQTLLPTILWEDNHLLIINKPSGWLSQGDSTGDESIVQWAEEYIRVKYQKPGAAFVGLVHRLDRVTSGVIVLTRTSKALERMNKLLADRVFRKTYLAITERALPGDGWVSCEHHLVRHGEKNLTMAYDRPKKRSVAAKLRYRLMFRNKFGYGYVVQPETGRQHQIRVQLKQMGSPIVGDLKYGAAKSLPNACIALHAWHIAFEHPVKKEPMAWFCSLPEELWWREAKGLAMDWSQD